MLEQTSSASRDLSCKYIPTSWGKQGSFTHTARFVAGKFNLLDIKVSSATRDVRATLETHNAS